MADLPVIVSVRIADADGEIFSMPLLGITGDTNTLAQVVLAAQAVLSDLDAILDGQMIKAGVCFDVALPVGVKTSPVAGSEIERTGLIPFTNDVTPYAHSVDIPAFKYAKFVSGTNRINMADTDVAAFTSNFTVNGGAILWTDRGANVLSGVKEGSKTFRKHRGQTKRT